MIGEKGRQPGQPQGIWGEYPDAAQELRYHHERKESFGAIARKLTLRYGVKFTRNACIGKGRRLGLDQRQPRLTPGVALQRATARAAVKEQRRRERRAEWARRHGDFDEMPRLKSPSMPRPPAMPLRPIMDATGYPSLNVPLVDLQASQCRFITSPLDAVALFCGQPTAAASSWCGHHFHVVFQPHQRRASPEETAEARKAATINNGAAVRHVGRVWQNA